MEAPLLYIQFRERNTLDKNTTAGAIAEISLGDGWTATVSLAGDMSSEDWRKCLADPETLTDDPQKVIRQGGSTRVIAKTIAPGGEPRAVVIKDEVKSVRFGIFLLSSSAQ